MIAAIPIIALLLALATPAVAETLSGDAHAIDGDSLYIGNRLIRLAGIDAPELDQQCLDAAEQPYPCGLLAFRHLEKLIAGERVVCTTTENDRFGRPLAVCETDRIAPDTLNGRMVLDGHARAFTRYSAEYVFEESSAQRNMRGIWQGLHIAPWQHREDRRGQ